MDTEVKSSNNNFYKILSLVLFLVLIGVLVYFMFFNKKETELEKPTEPEKPTEVGLVKYDKESYSCKVGEKILAVISTSHPTEVASVVSYTSKDSTVATIIEHPTESIDCIDCVAVQIICRKEGNTNLTAKNNYGATTSVPITVEKKEEVEEEPVGTIKFDKDSFSCVEGEKITATVEASGSKGEEDNIQFAKVESYKSIDDSVAVVEKHTYIGVSCTNCEQVQITCKKQGETKLLAKSTFGATVEVPIIVHEKSSISYDQESYSCKVGGTITAVIEALGSKGDKETMVFSQVASYDSSDRSIAKVTKHPNLAVNCINCTAVQITCKKKGKTTLKAESTFGDKTSVPITVK